jgi:choline dehydrogenase-like flavoprotein
VFLALSLPAFHHGGGDIMRAVTSTNTNAPTIMIAGKGAAMLKVAARERPAA